MTKKAAALLLAASLAVSMCATPVFADYDMGKQDGSQTTGDAGLTTHVYYEVTEGYTWSVPSTIDFGKDAGVNQRPTVKAGFDTESGTKASENNNWQGTAPTVKVTKNTIKPGKSLKIKLAGKDEALNGFVVYTTNNHGLEFGVKTTKEKKDGVETAAYQGIDVDPHGSQIFELNAGVDTGAVELEFELNTAKDVSNGGAIRTAEFAGEYTGLVKFTADATQDATT